MINRLISKSYESMKSNFSISQYTPKLIINIKKMKERTQSERGIVIKTQAFEQSTGNIFIS